MRLATSITLLLSCLLPLGCRAQVRPRLVGRLQPSPVSARLQAVMAVDDKVVWASGLEGSVLRSTDGGEHWHQLAVPAAESLQFRDIHAFDKSRALLLSSGEGSLSRIYKTNDGGQSWFLQFQNTEAAGFLDCFDFWDDKRGIAYGDSVRGQLYVLTTSDGGDSWQRIASEFLPAAGDGEGGFAASGTCVRVGEDGQAWIGTGAGGHARVLTTVDWGASWTASSPPMVKGETAGIMSVLREGDTLLALGGDVAKPEEVSSNVASSIDGGKTWSIACTPTFSGPIYGDSAVDGLVVAVGPRGIAVSSNGASSWTQLSAGEFWSVAFGSPTRFWAVGPGGTIMRFDLR